MSSSQLRPARSRTSNPSRWWTYLVCFTVGHFHFHIAPSPLPSPVSLPFLPPPSLSLSCFSFPPSAKECSEEVGKLPNGPPEKDWYATEGTGKDEEVKDSEIPHTYYLWIRWYVHVAHVTRWVYPPDDTPSSTCFLIFLPYHYTAYTLLLPFSPIQEEDVHKAQLIELNIDLIDRATLVIRSAIANAMDWGDIELLVKDAQGRGDPVAMAIQSLKLKSNEITLILRWPTTLAFCLHPSLYPNTQNSLYSPWVKPLSKCWEPFTRLAC